MEQKVINTYHKDLMIIIATAIVANALKIHHIEFEVLVKTHDLKEVNFNYRTLCLLLEHYICQLC